VRILIEAQDVSMLPSIKPDIPTSPQAQAFVRLGEYTIDNNIGTPNISIPLLEIDYCGYKIPIQLNYEAKPLRPGYNYDVYGLGWALSGHSCVSRTIKDIADEYAQPTAFKIEIFLEHNGKPKMYGPNKKRFDPIYKNLYDKITAINDTKSDNYKIVLPTGRVIPFFMYMGTDGMKYDLLSIDKNIKIKCQYGNRIIESFIVTDEEGIVYTFDVADKASNIFENDRNATANVSWQLSSINIPGKGIIKYEYTSLIKFSEYTKTEPLLCITRVYRNWFYQGELDATLDRQLNYSDLYGEPPYKISLTKVEQPSIYSMRFLKKITYGNTSIEFNYQSDGRHLASIVQTEKSKNVTASRNFSFNINDQQLLNLSIGSGSDNLVYKFSYASKYTSDYTDHWGNYGKSTTPEDIGNFQVCVDNTSFSESDMKSLLSRVRNRAILLKRESGDIPEYFKLKLQSSVNGDSRIATPPDVHGVLRSITYPNGGATWFTFENHRFLTANSVDGKLITDRTKMRIIEGGGFRIKSIVNYSADGEQVSCDDYCYGYTNKELSLVKIPFPQLVSKLADEHTGCGEAVVDPNVLTYMNYDYSTSTIPGGFLQMITNIKASKGSFEDHNSYTIEPIWWWNARFSAANFRNLLGDRPAVVYPEITIYHGGLPTTNACIGKTVLSFDIYRKDYTASDYYLCAVDNSEIAPYTAYFEPLRYGNGTILYCDEKPEKTNQLKSKVECIQRIVSANVKDWIPVTSEEYDYREYTMQKYGFTYSNAYATAHCKQVEVHGVEHSVGQNEEFVPLSVFYGPVWDRKGTNRLYCKKVKEYSGMTSNTTSLSESYEYLYGNKISSKNFWDFSQKQDAFSFVGEDINSESPVMTKMVSKNMFALITSATTTATSSMGQRQIDGYKIEYGEYNDDGKYRKYGSGGSYIYPRTFYEFDGKNWIESIKVESYTTNGKPVDIVDKKTGVHTIYLWGYGNEKLIAEIQNTTLSALSSVISSIDLDAPDEGLKKLRQNSALTQSLIKTWTYKPLCGVKSFTDENGVVYEYEYDALGRLTKESKQGEVVATHQYNYHN
jgi:YD repeat-containing protein